MPGRWIAEAKAQRSTGTFKGTYLHQGKTPSLFTLRKDADLFTLTKDAKLFFITERHLAFLHQGKTHSLFTSR
jgi:hypothetical protein